MQVPGALYDNRRQGLQCHETEAIRAETPKQEEQQRRRRLLEESKARMAIEAARLSVTSDDPIQKVKKHLRMWSAPVTGALTCSSKYGVAVISVMGYSRRMLG